jgi:hypothetical protein
MSVRQRRAYSVAETRLIRAVVYTRYIELYDALGSIYVD